MIAMAIACDPANLSLPTNHHRAGCDHPSQILHFLQHLRESTRTSILLITHDLGVVAEITDKVCWSCMPDASREEAGCEDLFDNPSILTRKG